VKTLQEAVRFVLVIGTLVGIACFITVMAGHPADWGTGLVASGLVGLIYGSPIGLVVWILYRAVRLAFSRS
jgi:nicotinamide riboside transporter PnuC